jgi:Fur family ferric uptake transcriptional regulator
VTRTHSTLERTLRDHDHRLTTPRRVVWEVLHSTDHHLSAAEIASAARRIDPGINASSVYRTLALFAELDLVRESQLGDGPSTWEPDHDDHVIHLHCNSCGTTSHHDARGVAALHTEISEGTEFMPLGIDIRVFGICPACRSARPS